MNLKDKLFIDAAVATLLILCIEYDATGSFIHELIGVILITGLLTHVIIHIKYYRILGSVKTKNLTKFRLRRQQRNIIICIKFAVSKQIN